MLTIKNAAVSNTVGSPAFMGSKKVAKISSEILALPKKVVTKKEMTAILNKHQSFFERAVAWIGEKFKK